MVQDYNKTGLEYLLMKKSDYLVLDFVDARMPLLQKDMHCITQSLFFRNYREILNEILDIGDYTFVDPFEDIEDKHWVYAIEKICKEIQKHYSPSQIIVNKHYGVEKYLKRGNVYDFSHNGSEKMDPSNITSFYFNIHGIRKINELANRLFPILTDILKGCHVIKFPDHTIADSAHKWGLNPLHYTSEYYEYGSKAVEIICERNSGAQEQRKLSELWEAYSEKNELRLSKYENASLKARNYGLTNAVNFTRALVYDCLESDNFKQWLEDCVSSGKKVAVLKCRDVAGQILHNALDKYNIEIIMESSRESFAGLSADEIELCRKADVIICADVHSTAPIEYEDMKAVRIADLIK